MTEANTPIGVKLICGFLGSGKTTRINALIADGEFKDALFLVNDFGNLNIDASLIESREGEVVRLSNGCACCGLAGDLSAQLRRIRRWPKPPSQLVMEASGVARPRPLAQLFSAAPGYALEQVEFLVDASTLVPLLSDPSVGELVRDQCQDVEEIRLNRWRHMAVVERNRLVAQLESLNPRAVLHWDETPGGDFDRGDARMQNTAHDIKAPLETISVRLAGCLDSSRLAQALNDARPFLLRAKGFIHSSKPRESLMLVQWTPSGCRFTPAHGKQPGLLVLIGKGRDNLEVLAERLSVLSQMAITASLR
ncbi:MAG: CobW family GTP-binding protein [Halomonadaceae bacterium]|jgi:G3E family GTPase